MGTEKIELIAELKDLVSGKMQEITSQVNRLEGSLKNAGTQAGGSNGGLMKSVLGANLLTNAISGAGSPIVGFAKDSIDAYGRQEQFLTSLTTMFHGNADEARMLNSELKAFAKSTPFELTGIQDATKMMIAYGSTSQTITKELTMLGDISSGVGAPLQDIAYLYGTLRTQGRAYAMDIRQFAGRGIPIIEALATQFKVSKTEVMKLVEAGKVGFPEVEKALKSLTESGGQFHDMMKEQSKTLVGQTSNLSDAWDQLKTNIGNSQSGILKSTVQWASEMVNQINKSFDVSEFTKNATNGLGKAAFANQGVYLRTDNLIDDRHTKGGDITGQQRLDGFAEKIMNKVSLTTAENALQTKKELDIEYRKLLREKRFGEGMSAEYFATSLALIADGVKSVNQKLMLNTKKDEKAAVVEKKASELEKVAAANKPTQIHINIENLVRGLTNNVYNNTGQAMQLTEEDVARALISAVNDIAVAELK